MKKPTPDALALSDDVATMANQLSALATRADKLQERRGPLKSAHPAYYALNLAWHHLDAAHDLLKEREPKR